MQNLKWKTRKIKDKILSLKFNCFIKNLPKWRKKLINERFSTFKKTLNLRFILIKKIRLYKKGNYFIFLTLNKLKKIYLRLNYKINKMKYFKENNILKMYKLWKFIKNNKLKKKPILKLLGLKLRLNKNRKIG